MPSNNSFDFLIQWHLTEKCNLKCLHCYQTGQEQDELSSEEVNDTIEEIIETLNSWRTAYGLDFSPSVNITGGEPFLRKDLFEILASFIDGGFDAYLLTNGILIDSKKASKLSRTGVKGVQVSIEGPEEVHDSIRGKGSFSASLKGIKNLVNADLEVTLNATVSRLNAEHLVSMIGLASGLGVQRLGFSRLVPSGRGRSLTGEMLKPGMVKDLYETVFSIVPENGLEIVTGDPVASQFRNNPEETGLEDIPLGGCAAGVTGLTIMPDGTVVPCRRLPVPLGNVRNDSLREIWSSSKILNDLRTRSMYTGKCGSCNKWANCRGCRAIAYFHSMANGKGDILASDPQCFI
jgi:radical SAM protein with 4Fe4S-binding SPASM domain